QEASARGELPKDGIISSVLVLVGGVLLVTPGVVTDVVGLTLLVPAARRFVAKQVRGSLEKRFELTAVSPAMFVQAGSPLGGEPDGVIDVDARVADDDDSESPQS
ncbi:MAG: FxsA family protein, partial [Myxococcota bacterium]